MPARELVIVGFGLVVLGGDPRSQGDAPAASVTGSLFASVLQIPTVTRANPFDSRYQPDGLPIAVPIGRVLPA